MKQVAYYKGCLASLSAKELDTSTRALAPKVGYELLELESVTCCGAGDIHEAEPDYYLHLNARILAYAAATGADTLMTVCNVCTLNLRQANHQLLNDAALRERVNDNLERVGAPRYETDVECVHFLWLVAGESFASLREVAHKGLRGLKIAPFYGCQILRPSKLMGFDDPDRPDSLERIITACGGEPIDYPAKIKCCGFPIIQAREDTALGELIQPIEQAKEAGADAIVTPCPLCHLSLDAWQSKLKQQTGKDFQMPILHLSQLIGVAAGLEDSRAPLQAARRLDAARAREARAVGIATRERRRNASSHSASATSDQPRSSSPSFATIWYSAIGSPRWRWKRWSSRSSPLTKKDPPSTTVANARRHHERADDPKPTNARSPSVERAATITNGPMRRRVRAVVHEVGERQRQQEQRRGQQSDSADTDSARYSVAAPPAATASARVETMSGRPLQRSRSTNVPFTRRQRNHEMNDRLGDNEHDDEHNARDIRRTAHYAAPPLPMHAE